MEWEIKRRIGGNGLSIIGGPSLFPVTELSTELFRFWNSISSWGFRFVKCGAGSSLSTSSGSREGDRGDPDFKSPLYGGRFLSYQARVCWGGQGRRIGSRGDAYASSLSIGFPSFAVSGEGDKGEAPNMFYPQPPSVISNLNSLFLFTSTLRATTSSPFTSKGKG